MTATAVGQTLGRFRLTKEIGRGGMGTVYKAFDTEMQRDVAVKVLASELATQPGFAARFRREAQTAARLSEPHILPVFEAGELDGQLYLVMPLVEGVDLHRLLHRDGPIKPERAVAVISDVASALDSAHAAGLFHRDVKPSNILVDDAKGFVFLIDFGIAQDSSATKLTSAGTTVGTWAYMAPERFTTGASDARADIYSLACVLYECLTGKLPYPGDNMPQQVHGHCYLPTPKPTDVKPKLSAGFDEVIARGMAKDPDRRYKTCRELAVAARLALSGPAPTMPPTQAARAKNRSTGRPREFAKPAPRPALVEPPRPWSNSRVSAMVAAVAAVALTGAFLLVNHSSLPGLREAQVELPFRDLEGPEGIAVDGKGTVYVADYFGDQVLKLDEGSSEQVVLPFSAMSHPGPLALDHDGNLFVGGFDRATSKSMVMELESGAHVPRVLPIHLDGVVDGVAVDDLGAVYVVGGGAEGGLYKLAPGAENLLKLLTGSFSSVALDAVGNVYLASETDHPNISVLPVSGRATKQKDVRSASLVTGIAVDGKGNIYISDGWGDSNQVYKLPTDGSAPTSLHFEGLAFPKSLTRGLAVDDSGNVYVTDSKLKRVIELRA